MKGNLFLSSIIACVMMTVCCIVCFTGATWAWFSTSVAVKTGDIVSAYCEIETVVEDQNGNIIQPGENGEYSFAENVLYTVTITAKGNASSGFASFTVDGVNYFSVYLNPKEEESITFDILNYGGLSDVAANWGEIESEETPVVDGDTRFVKIIESPIVKLVPVITENDDGTTTASTAMIERGKVVETYNAGILDGTDRLPTKNQLTAIEADEDHYEYPQYEENATEYNSWYVYGLAKGLNIRNLQNYITVSNGGHYVVEGVYRGTIISTGTVIKVYDKDNNFIEQFRVVIYGDIDSNGVVNGTDSQIADDEVVTRTFSSRQGQANTPYLFRAADLDQNVAYNGTDDQLFREVIIGSRAVNQVTGRAELKS